MNRHWHIMDASLEDCRGAEYWGARALTQELARRGIEYTVYGNRALKNTVLPDLRAVPLFDFSLYVSVLRVDDWAEIEDFILMNRTFQANLSQIDHRTLRGSNVLFPTTTHRQILGIMRWIGAMPAESRPAVALTLLFPPDWTQPRRPDADPASFYRRLWSSCAPEVRSRIAACVQTEEIAREYEPVLGFRPRVLPYYMDWISGPADPRAGDLLRRNPSDIAIACLGVSRGEKGYHLLPEVAALCRAADPRTQFIVQSTESTDPLVHEARKRLEAQPNIRLMVGSFEPAAYSSVLGGADLVLLPYYPPDYLTRSSGVFLQAAAAGVPVVVPAGTWMADRVQRDGNGVAFDAFTPQSVARATLAAIARLEPLRAAAHRHAAEFRPQNGTAAYVDAIIAATASIGT